MSALGHVFGELFGNVVSNMAGVASSGSSPVERMAGLCRQAGYSVGGKSGNTLILHVRTPIGISPVTILCESHVTVFRCSRPSISRPTRSAPNCSATC